MRECGRLRRVLRVAGALVVAFLIGVMAVGGFYEFGIVTRNERGIVYAASVIDGRLVLVRDAFLVDPLVGWRMQRAPGFRLRLGHQTWGWQMNRQWAKLVALPLWWGIVGVAIPTGLAWGLPWVLIPSRRGAWREARGFCPSCGYVLGSDIDRGCPECGWKRRSIGAVPVADGEKRE